MAKNDTTIDVKAAERAVEALESLADGEAWAESARAAGEAVAAVRALAEGELFTCDVRPVGADVLADLEIYTEAASDGIAYSGFLVDLHRRALKSYPSLSTLLRSGVVLTRIARHVLAAAHGREGAPGLVEGHLREYQAALAGQLVGHEQLGGPAGILADLVPGLERRIQTAVAKHEAHAAAVLAREADQNRVAGKVLAEQRAQEQRDAAAAAADAELAQRRAEIEARRQRAVGLADRIEAAGKPMLRVNPSEIYRVDYLCTMLRRNQYSHETLAKLEAALAKAAA